MGGGGVTAMAIQKRKAKSRRRIINKIIQVSIFLCRGNFLASTS
jgi:hypothetical protein